MMEESLHGEYRLSSLDHRHDERRRAGRWYGATVVRTIDGTVQQEWPLWPLLDVPLTGRAPRRAETSYIAALSIVWRIVAAIRLWRGRARSRRQLHELNDHLLKDIGLSERTLVTICRKGSE